MSSNASPIPSTAKTTSSVKTAGAKGDGSTDDTAAIQAAITNYAGLRLSSSPLETLGKSASNLVPVFKVGKSGDTGVAELSDLVFSTQGPQPGAVLVEWNIHDPSGSQGSADHDLDGSGNQLSIYNARGILIESSNGPVWLYGTATEHNVLYQYQLSGASNVYMGMIQTETPYYQPAPIATSPYSPISSIADPTFSNCAANDPTCAMAWGLRVLNAKNVFVYGSGLYNFFVAAPTVPKTTSTTTKVSTTTTTSSASSTTTSSSEWTSLGCYVDALTPRTLPYGAPAVSAGMTVEVCESESANAGYSYAGVLYGNECWCGNAMPPTSAPATDCYMACKDNTAEMCGAGARFIVYKKSS